MQTGTGRVLSRFRPMLDRVLRFLNDQWRLVILVAWLGYCLINLIDRSGQIRAFGLSDTDDNMRMMQVRGLLAGQDWFDLRQYRMNPPFGANIHWSRVVDLPIAGLILLSRPFVGGPDAERIGAAVAPLFPLLPMLLAMALTARRLIAPLAYPLALVALFFSGSTAGMFAPMRIDHHGWQLALLAVSMAAVTDPRPARGGAVLGIASALSLTIGLEMLIYIAISGAAMVLFWVREPAQRPRLAAFAAALSGGCAIGFAGFASYANRLPVCDALSPVWLSDALIGGALMLGMAFAPLRSWQLRLSAAALSGIILAAFHALTWPHCLSRLEGISPEVTQLWLSHVREARPVWKGGWRLTTAILALPVAGLLGYILLGWKWRADGRRFWPMLVLAITAVVAGALLFWQTRTAPAAQMLAVPGAIALPWLLLPAAIRARRFIPALIGATAAGLLGLGALSPMILSFIEVPKSTPAERAVGRANSQCPTLWALKPVALQPQGVVFTFLDLGPRLITVTHHSAIAGPYHRNGDAIADVMHAFRGSADQAHAIILRHHSDYVLICPGMSQSTIFMAEAPKGFYGQLARREIPAWLQPVPLPKGDPLRLYRVVG